MKDIYLSGILRISIIWSVLFIFLNNNEIFSTDHGTKDLNSKFKVVFVADVRVASNKEWLKKVANDWGATGICLRIFWGHVDTDDVPGADNWSNLDRAIKTITDSKFNDKKLDIYLRVCLGLQKPSWVSPTNFRFVRDDFQIKYDNSIYNHQDYEKRIPESEKHPLNFNSPVSQSYMKNFLKEVLIHINTQFPDSIKSRIKELVPTFSTSDEEEYPFAAMCGYSFYENEKFINSLKIKYENNLEILNNRWNPENDFAKISSWSQISPLFYDWHTYVNSDYFYPNGRVDWINFRTEQLAEFLDSLSVLITSYGFQMGVQVGSIYDDLIERRGWVDPTILFEGANAIHVADIFQYRENFDFGANYLSSISKFWTKTNGWDCNPVRFSTETNWPNFYGRDAEFLSFYWREQLISYFNQGASEHYLVGWDVAPQNLDNLKSSYELWRNTLVEYSGREITKKNIPVAVFIGMEQVFYNHNKKSIWNKKFELTNFFITQYESDKEKNIITSYMLEKNPAYVMNYNSIYFAVKDSYITDKALKNLTQFFIEKSWVENDLMQLKEKIAEKTSFNNEYNETYQSIPSLINLNK